MHFFDPARPKVNDKPCYMDKNSRSIAPLPSLDFSPNANGTFLLSLMLKKFDPSGNYFHWEHMNVLACDVEELLYAYRDNPEEFLEKNFNYTGPGKLADRQLSLEDLGL